MNDGGKRRAIVMGGSMAGLVAARVCADHFDEVTVIERDELPEGAEARKGVPQAPHAHGLLAKGLNTLTGLFPDLRDGLLRAGAIEIDIAKDFGFYIFGGWKMRVPANIRGLFQSRPLLEWEVRKRVAANPKVKFLTGCKVESLVASEDKRTVTGVKVTGGGGGERTLEADLVVDATGRGSRMPEWLASLGYAKPEESEVKAGLAYATRFFKREGLPKDYAGVIVAMTPPAGKRIGVAFPMEGDRWVCTLAGYHKDHAPTDDDGYLAFAKSLPVSDVYDIISKATPLTPVQVYKFSGSVRRHYEKIDLPKGVVVLGDALTSFNPLFGQGMTTGALAAVKLGECIQEQRGDLAGLTKRFQKKVTKVIDPPWMLATGEDFRYAETEGKRPPGTDVVNRYTARMHRASARDPKVALAFYDVMHLLQPPESLFHPKFMIRILGGAGREAAASDVGSAMA